MQSLLGRTYTLPLLLKARSFGPNSFPSSVADSLTISDSPAGNAVTYMRRTLFINPAATAFANQLMGSTSTWFVYYAPTPVTSSPSDVGDSLSISDTVIRGALGLSRAVNDSLTISDSPAPSVSLPRNAADSLVISDSPSGTAVTSSSRRTMVLSSAYQTSLTYYTWPTPPIIYYAPTAISSQSALVNDTLNISDSVVASGSTQARSVSDTLTISDSPAGSTVTGGQGRRLLLISPAAQQQATQYYYSSYPPLIQYAPTAIVSQPVMVADVLTIVDDVQGSASTTDGSRRTLGVWSDAGNRAIQYYTQSWQYSPLFMWSVVWTADTARNVDDTLTIADGIVKGASTRTRSVADSLTISDGSARTLSIVRGVSDTLTITDTVTRSSSRPRSVSDSLTITDSTFVSGTPARQVGDSITIVDGIVRIVVLTRAVADGLTLLDALARIAGHPRFAADTLTITDSTFNTSSPNRFPVDSLNITDAVTRIVSRVRFVSDSMPIVDSPFGVAVEGPYVDTDWVTELVGFESSVRSSLSNSYVYVVVYSDMDVRADTVEMAVVPMGENPTEAAWKPAIWTPESTATKAVARVQVLDLQLESGDYMAWVRITHPPIRPVLRSGKVRVF